MFTQDCFIRKNTKEPQENYGKERKQRTMGWRTLCK